MGTKVLSIASEENVVWNKVVPKRGILDVCPRNAPLIFLKGFMYHALYI